jgi:hypothetical protein
MGKLYYGADTEAVVIPDRLLSHIKVVAATKLRRNESFTLSWVHAPGEPVGRSTLWLQPSIPMRFVFDSVEPEQLDPSMLRTLADQAASSAGMHVDLTKDDFGIQKSTTERKLASVA